ncbi:hypothetical protein HKT18_13175 [Flavobacterium sp. IMCC34852]|uniref:Outer membrane protein beta-barrel domain-containing protein n=1 Tax=Flavobacterium rivulicola TaxID=2732161 RepID=A0A7Y3W041_9FLAO|nr:hypothetical protein [Flavobacterium sp. IMCC34852]NNT73171.1 hypothetical protein [Flavobacterium sp. IMCC34852]
MIKQFSLLLILIACNISAQETTKPETKKKNTISIEFYQPIQNSLREFYNDDWLLSTYPTERNNYSRNSFSNAFGISYERTKNDVVFRARLGITIREIKEHQDFEYINTNENTKININQNYHYSQNHINVFVGIAKRIHLANNFDFDFGIDLASVYYLEGSGDYDYDSHITNLIDNSTFSHQIITVEDRIGKIYGFGLGPVFKPQYAITKNLVVAAELQVYFMKTFTNDKSTRVETSDYYVPSQDYSEHTKLYGDINYDVNQWNWTKVSPLIRIGYQF